MRCRSYPGTRSALATSTECLPRRSGLFGSPGLEAGSACRECGASWRSARHVPAGARTNRSRIFASSHPAVQDRVPPWAFAGGAPFGPWVFARQPPVAAPNANDAKAFGNQGRFSLVRWVGRLEFSWTRSKADLVILGSFDSIEPHLHVMHERQALDLHFQDLLQLLGQGPSVVVGHIGYSFGGPAGRRERNSLTAAR